MDKPMRPSDPRPNGEPYYIDSTCPDCGSELELYDEDSGWNDEWICPECDDGLYMDWPPSMVDEMKERIKGPSDEFKHGKVVREIGVDNDS